MRTELHCQVSIALHPSSQQLARTGFVEHVIEPLLSTAQRVE
jgi:hypothetical protein